MLCINIDDQYSKEHNINHMNDYHSNKRGAVADRNLSLNFDAISPVRIGANQELT